MTFSRDFCLRFLDTKGDNYIPNRLMKYKLYKRQPIIYLTALESTDGTIDNFSSEFNPFKDIVFIKKKRVFNHYRSIQLNTKDIYIQLNIFI